MRYLADRSDGAYTRRILAPQHEAETLLSDRAGTAAIRIGLPEDIITLLMSEGWLWHGDDLRHFAEILSCRCEAELVAGAVGAA